MALERRMTLPKKMDLLQRRKTPEAAGPFFKWNSEFCYLFQ